MDIFTLEPLPARHGDCLLLHFGAAEKPGTIVIDGGPSQVYGKALKPRLKALAAKRPGSPFSIDLLMVSHIDDDHIRGVLDFTEEWRNAKTDGEKWPLKVEQLWHNSFERIAGADANAVQASITASFGTASLAAVANLEADDHDVEAVYKVLASVGQGAQLRSDADLLALPRNSGFDGLVVPSADREPVRFGDKLELQVVGPLPDQVKKLREEFAKQLPKGRQEALAAYSDTSIANLSSIVVLARYQGKTMLLTGDARGDYVLEGLAQQKLLDAKGRLHVDILKMQHHGSDRNTEVGFFEKVTADHYIASANGTYENPDRATFEMLVKARPKTDRYSIYLTYELDAIDLARKAERAKSIQQAQAKHKQPPPTWKDEADGLVAFFAECAKAGYLFTVTTPATRPKACIDLLSAVTY